MSSQTALLVDERQAEILRRLASSDRVIAGDLAQEFQVSEDTIRRDLRELAASGHCIRVYGGALPLPAQLVPLSERYAVNQAQKRALAAVMLSFVKRGMTLFLDAGSTNLAVAHALPDNLNLSVVTNAPHIAAAVLDRPGLRLYVIGGKIDYAVGAAIGSQSQREIEQLRPDIAFVGACAVDGTAGVSAFDPDDAEFKRVLTRQSRMSLIGVVNEKIGVVAPFPVLPLSAFDHIIVEKELDPAKRASLGISKPALLDA